MLTVFDPAGKSQRMCDGVSRRNFLKIGALGAAGLTLPQLFSAEAAAGIRNSKKSVILIYLVGGPPHQDMFDLKPDAPAEIAGPMRPISTNVSGIEICELLPMMSKMMDKFAVIRSLSDAQAGHDAFLILAEMEQCAGGAPRDRPGGRAGWRLPGGPVARGAEGISGSVVAAGEGAR